MAEDGEKSYDPGTRIKNLSAQANNVQMDKNIPPRRYFRSGVELERMVRHVSTNFIKVYETESCSVLIIFPTLFLPFWLEAKPIMCLRIQKRA